MTRKIIDEQGNEVVPARAGDPATLTRAEVEVMAEALLTQVPDPADDDGTGVYARLLEATSWEDFNTPSKLPAGKELIGRTLRVMAIVKRPTDIEAEDGDSGFRLSHYLVIDSVEPKTGEMVRWQTSAPGLVLPIAKLYAWGKLPAVVRIDAVQSKNRAKVQILNLTVLAVG